MSRLLDVHNFVGDKLRWQAQVLLDVRLSASARLVGCLIAHDLNVDRGAAWRAQENMAIALGVHLSTIRRGVAELAGAGHLAVRRSFGRGRTQNYVAMLLDAAEAHDSIDQAIQARKSLGTADLEKVAPVNIEASEKVAPVNSQAPEKVAPVNSQASEKVAPVNGKGGASERQYLYEPSTPPLPPTRANRVRESWGSAITVAPFPASDVRGAVALRLGEKGAQSWLDPAAWDRESRTIVTKLRVQAEKLQADCGFELSGLGVNVLCDKARHGALSRQPRTVLATGMEKAA